VAGKRAPVSAEACRAGGYGRAAKVGDAVASLRDEVLGGQRAEFLVSHPDIMSAGAGQHAVNQNIGYFIAVELFEKIEPALPLS